MGKAITYKEVGNVETWRKIGEITGAGHVPVGEDGDAAIDITELPPGKASQLDKLLDKTADTEAADADKAKKGGGK